MITAAALGFANHLLSGEDWARVRLKPFAGQVAKVVCPPFELRFEIAADGQLHSAASGVDADLVLTLPPDALGRAPAERDAVLAAAHIQGSAEFAEGLAFVLRNLRWDVEDDLSHLVGDIAARRLVQGGRALFAWQIQAAKNLAHNLAEYFVEENPLLAGQAEFAALTGQLDMLARQTAALERRLDILVGGKQIA